MAGYSYKIVSIGLIGHLPISESWNSYVLVMVDLFNRYCEAIPLAEVDAVTKGRTFLKDWVTLYPPPPSICIQKKRQILRKHSL